MPTSEQLALNIPESEKEKIREMAVIYKKEKTRKLSNYHKAMNKAAQDLCIRNPALLRQRSVLIEKAREKIVAEGFQFVKGKSRSKKESIEASESSDSTERGTKRRKLSKSIRSERLEALGEDLKNMDDRIKFKEKRIAGHENMKEYKKCDDLLEEIAALKQQRRQLLAEKKKMTKSVSQSKWYYKKKMEQMSNDVDETSSSNSSKNDRNTISPVSPFTPSSDAYPESADSMTPQPDGIHDVDSMNISNFVETRSTVIVSSSSDDDDDDGGDSLIHDRDLNDSASSMPYSCDAGNDSHVQHEQPNSSLDSTPPSTLCYQTTPPHF